MTERSCPICSRPVASPEYRPFCSKRCADVDLQRWFSGSYAVPAVEISAGEELDAGEAGRDQIDPL